MKATTFKFSSFKLEAPKRRVLFTYEIKFGKNQTEEFTEQIIFPRELKFNKIPKELLNNFLEDLHLVLGLSYYKLYVPPKFECPYKLSKRRAELFNAVYHRGLGEFCYRNGLKFKQLASFVGVGKEKREAIELELEDKCLVGVGGGKDSALALELLKKEKMSIVGFLLETDKDLPIAREIIKIAKVSSLIVERKLDPKIFSEWSNSYNGHIPISAIIAFIGSLVAVLSGQRYLAVANEQSSNFGNLTYDGEEINHQWSKTAEFETIFQDYVESELVAGFKYFSPLRPYHEIRVVEEFVAYKKYLPIFTSCNRNFRIHSPRPGARWCGECPKCVFMFALLAAVLPKEEVVKIFNKNLFADEKLLPLYRDLSGLGGLKPFDCVGTFAEMQVAIWRAKDKFGDTIILEKLLPAIKVSPKLIKDVFSYHEAPTVPERFRFVGVRKVLILGYAIEGKENEKFMKKNYPWIELGIADASQGQDYLTKQDDYDLGIKTAGMPRGLVAVPYTTGTNIFLSRNKNLVVGVTGSKGKSTTSSLIYDMLKAGGLAAKLMGNIGEPMLGYLGRKNNPKEILVIELSSYQLEDIRFSPAIAVATNLFPEHLDYHNGLDNYYLAKKNILKFQKAKDIFVYSPKIKEFKKWAKDSGGEALPGEVGMKISLVGTRLAGEHNLDNIYLSARVAKLFRVSDRAIRQAVKDFRPLPHRLEEVGKYRGIIFYDDAISTAPESTILAIKALGKVGTIFLGGKDRGYDFNELEKVVKKEGIKNIILFPETGRRMFKDRVGFNILDTDKMEEAVKFAYQYTKSGEIVLLSTASPSYGLWKNYQDKGDEFKKYVKKYSKS